MADLAESVFTALRAYVDRELGKLALRMNTEQSAAFAAIKPGERGERGEKGDRGEAAQIDEAGIETRLHERIFAFVGSYLRELPKPEKGERGEPGTKGDAGDSIKGDKGDKGERGERGEKGDAGESVKGERGERGEKGDAGESVKGEKGDKGETGDAGISIKGEKGERGEQGDVGLAGLSVKGERGERGEKGDAGLSAFQIAKASGFVGSEADWLISLRAEDGEDGLRGPAGRDATQIDIMAGIDIARSYPRDTYAAFNGGLFVAVRETEPLQNAAKPALAGWHAILVGIQSDVETLEDGGRFRVRTVTMSDGTVSVQKQKTKMQIYRGVFKAGRAYDEGDTVTDYGSEWAAIEDNKERPKQRDLSGPQAWVQCVKGGKDGRDAIKGQGRDDYRAPLQ